MIYGNNFDTKNNKQFLDINPLVASCFQLSNSIF